ncbi:hypothetical protein [Capnocytophaga sp. HP1101]
MNKLNLKSLFLSCVFVAIGQWTLAQTQLPLPNANSTLTGTTTQTTTAAQAPMNTNHLALSRFLPLKSPH